MTDPGGSKTYGSNRSGSGSTTLLGVNLKDVASEQQKRPIWTWQTKKRYFVFNIKLLLTSVSYYSTCYLFYESGWLLERGAEEGQWKRGENSWRFCVASLLNTVAVWFSIASLLNLEGTFAIVSLLHSSFLSKECGYLYIIIHTENSYMYLS